MYGRTASIHRNLTINPSNSSEEVRLVLLRRGKDQTASRLPRRRLDAITLRPPTVLIRTRNPCVFARLTTVGLVRFMTLLEILAMSIVNLLYEEADTCIQ